ncbi:MAG: cell division protein ZapA [Pseudomonadota bacterium]
MPEVTITIGGRNYAVACQEGEEQYLLSAARLLDLEAAALGTQASALPEPRLLLMAGLMLADKTAGFEEQLRATEERLKQRDAEVEALRAGAPAPAPDRERVEVPVLPDGLLEDMVALTEKAERIASDVEEKAAALT